MRRKPRNITIPFDAYSREGREFFVRQLFYEAEIGYSSDAVVIKLAQSVIKVLLDMYCEGEDASLEDLQKHGLPIASHVQHVETRTLLESLYNQMQVTVLAVERMNPQLKS
ncbi:MAG TPA: hypothetical protein PKD24_05645 [Pyrinomonadaceae bacterium]|nr:hypothetical protein [Pyrinomonadaceae bacterium]HMP65034.1 hypothetical protein [Pyrinomonadaceae bacterium]